MTILFLLTLWPRPGWRARLGGPDRDPLEPGKLHERGLSQVDGDFMVALWWMDGEMMVNAWNDNPI